MKSKLTNKEVEQYLIDCLGYDELSIEDIKERFKPLREALNPSEIQECIEYNR